MSAVNVGITTNKWWRSWHGAPTDTKWLSIARRAKVSPGMVASVVWALYDHASQAVDRGGIKRFDVEGLADFYGYEQKKIEAVLAAIREKEMVDDDNHLVASISVHGAFALGDPL